MVSGRSDGFVARCLFSVSQSATVLNVATLSDTKQINALLLRHRLAAGLNQREQAAAIGVSQRVYQAAEAGGKPQPRHIARFSAYYGLSAFDLFYPEMKEAA